MRSVVGLLCAVAAGPAGAGLVYGPSAEDLFVQWHATLGEGHHIDFESVPVGTRLLPGTDPFGVGARFASIINTSGQPFGPEHVHVSRQYAPGTFGNTIVGSPFQFGSDDGRVGYEVRFDDPQRRAAIRRLWNLDAATRFYAEDGTLLTEHRNTAGQEFIGWVGTDPDGSDWVARIVMDTAVTSGTRQVGYSDDLYFGVLIPGPAGLSALTIGLAVSAGRRRV